MIIEFVFNDLRSDLSFSRKSDRKREGEREIEGERERERERERSVCFHLRMSSIVFAAKHSWTTLHMSRPFFVGSYLGHLVDSRPMKKKTNLHRMIIDFN